MLILVTGASRGIGYELVKCLSRRQGVTVLAVSRKITPLRKLVRQGNTDSILPLQADITTLAGRKKILQTVSSLKIKLQVVINNAGLFVKQPFEKTTLAQLEAVYAANVFAPYM